jgi:hypothetical protein
MITLDQDWDPRVLDFMHNGSDDEWFETLEEHEQHPYHDLFDEYGNYRKRVMVQVADVLQHESTENFSDCIDNCIIDANDFNYPIRSNSHEIDTNSPPTPHVATEARDVLPQEPDYGKLRPCFGWISMESIKKTLQHTTQLARTSTGTLLKQTYRAQNPALNIFRRNEAVATDEVFSDTPAIDCGETSCQIFVGVNTDVVDVYPLQSSRQFVNTLEDNVRFRGAPSKLVSDRAQVEISGRALELLRVYAISSWQSEPHLHHQNYAERKIQQLKQMTNTIIDRTGAPPKVWLLCLMYVAYVLNHTWSDNIKNIPLTALLGITVDTSILLRYHFWQQVYFKAIEPGFPSDSKERLGHVVGISEHVGHCRTGSLPVP